LVKAHRELFAKANILHRDISINNLMVDPLDHNKGILIDLDLAVRVHGSDSRPVGKLPPPGTITFRAIDLCKDNPRDVYYRHDLESFLYVLVWILTHYHQGKEILGDQYRNWHGAEWSTISSSKIGFLALAKHYEFPSHTPLRDSWIAGLANLFNMGYLARLDALDSIWDTGFPQPFDEETLGGHVTYEKYLEILEAGD